jgi:hypothetical protein
MLLPIAEALRLARLLLTLQTLAPDKEQSNATTRKLISSHSIQVQSCNIE